MTYHECFARVFILEIPSMASRSIYCSHYLEGDVYREETLQGLVNEYSLDMRYGNLRTWHAAMYESSLPQVFIIIVRT